MSEPSAVLSLFAVHLSDGVLTFPVWAGGFVVAAAWVGWAAWRLDEREVPRVGVLAAAFFVASQVHLPLGGSSAHLLLNGLVGVVLRRRAPLAIAVGLGLQALLFGHGGLTALGVNVTVYSVPAVVAGLAVPRLRRSRRLPDFAVGAVLGGFAGLLTVLLTAGVLLVGGAGDFRAVAGLVLALNLPVVAVEAVGVGFVTSYLGRVRPDWLGDGQPDSGVTSSKGTSH